jgi:hypothetical protein
MFTTFMGIMLTVFGYAFLGIFGLDSVEGAGALVGSYKLLCFSFLAAYVGPFLVYYGLFKGKH